MIKKLLFLLVLLLTATTGAWAQEPATYAVKMANATDADAANWTIASGDKSVKGNVADGLTGLSEGAEVTVTYTGRMKVKSVTATTDVLLPTDLSKLTAAYTAEDGEILTGTTSLEISIAADATVTLKNATVNNRIKCLGTATIILADGSTNTVNASNYCAGIQIGGSGTTLTINAETLGTGKLNVKGGTNAAGIGTGEVVYATQKCGTITINGGTVTATGGDGAAGIGTGVVMDGFNICGTITINGGTVTATGGTSAAGIGTGRSDKDEGTTSNECGAITIAAGVTSVTATKGTNSPNSIGKGEAVSGGSQTCGTITIGGTVYWDGSDYQNGGGTYLTSDITYTPSN